jgi:hypothetical protein
MIAEIDGAWGTAELLPVEKYPHFAALVQHWLISSPEFDPVRTQFYLCATRLDGSPGIHPAEMLVRNATHQVTVSALMGDNEETPDSLARYWTPGTPDFGRMPVRVPADVVHQVQATDREMTCLGLSLARSVVECGWSPSATRKPSVVKMVWAAGITDGLARLRGQEARR